MRTASQQKWTINHWAPKLGSSLALQRSLELITAGTFNEQVVADGLRRLHLVLSDGAYRKLFFEAADSAWLAELLRSPSPSSDVLLTLQDLRILPTPAVLDYTRGKSAGDVRAGLEGERRAIADGGFTRAPLQVELEWSRCRHDPSPYCSWLSLERFSRIPWLTENGAYLTQKHRDRCSKVAEEAVDVLRLIRGRHKPDEGTLVIANARYGEQWVVDPIRPYLDALGAQVATEHVRSTWIDDRNEYVSPRTLRYIAEHHPNVVVVDGTRESSIKSEDGSCYTRFPAAMRTYAKTFSSPPIADSYRIAFWSPNLTDRIWLGYREHAPSPANGQQREALMISAAHASGAPFDDPDYMTEGKHTLVFTSTGFRLTEIATSTTCFVSALQEIVRREVELLNP